MSGLTEGKRQRREVNTYNLFHSAVSARANPSLALHGVRVPMQFPVISDRTGDISAEPDFVLYDGSTCVFVEIKSGNNINNQDISQMEDCAAIGIEAAESALRDAQVREKTSYDGEVDVTENIIIYQDLDESYIEGAISESEDFEDQLEELAANAVVMTQDYGGELRVLRGEFEEDGDLQSLLSSGIELPQNPPDTVLLTEAIEPEILSIAITDVWGDKALDHDDGVTVSRTEVRDFFAPQRNVDPSTLSLTFEFLVEFGACEDVGRDGYRFQREHIDRIIEVEPQVLEESIKDYLYDSEQQGLDDFET